MSLDDIRDRSILEMTIDENGHDILWGGWGKPKPQTLRVYKDTFKESGEVFLQAFSYELGSSCSRCGGYPSLVYVDDENARLAVIVGKDHKHFYERCTAEDGITSVVEIDVPSGKIFVDDALNPVFEISDEAEREMETYNCAVGQDQMIHAYADLGIAYGPVGNSCPGFWEVEPGKYVVANAQFLTDDGESELEESEIKTSFGGKKIAGILTDLWAYSIVDLDKFIAAGGDPKTHGGGYGVVVEVPAGRYRLSHHTNEKTWVGDNWGGEEIFAHFERIGDVE